MKQRRLTLAFSCVAAVGCTGCATPSIRSDHRPHWSYTKSVAQPPIASYGLPNTAAELSMECKPADDALHLVIIDTAAIEDREVVVRVGQFGLRLLERLDPPDGFATSRIIVPRGARLLEKFAAGAAPLMVLYGGEAFEFARGAVARQMIQDCLRFPR